MKRFLSILFAACMAAVLLTACVLTEKHVDPERKLQVGFYIDDGSRGGNVLNWARLLYYSPQLEVTLLRGQDLRNGKLEGLDLLIVPGGSSQKQYLSMREEGAEAIRKFVAAGGAYYGICAGFHCTLNRDERVKLLPFSYVYKGGGERAMLAIDLSEKGAKMLEIRPGRWWVQYSHGPICRPGDQPGEGWGEVLATYQSTVGPVGRNGGDFYGSPSIIYGQFGKGKVIATGFHPESWPSTYPIGLGCIYAVTGFRPVPEFPVKSPRPVRVGYMVPSPTGEPAIRQMLEIDREPDMDLSFCKLAEDADHLDAVVFPAPLPGAFRKMSAETVAAAKRFMDRGGRIYAKDPAYKLMPAHKNLKHLEKDASFVKAIRADF